MTTTNQISWPEGMVSHIGREVPDLDTAGRPWYHHGKMVMRWKAIYPIEQVNEGAIYILPEHCPAVGDPIQVDRFHGIVAAVGRPEKVQDMSSERRTVRACRVTIRDARWI